jgi:signal transduction histidine kinase/ActR/RegA family two-component response regulator
MIEISRRFQMANCFNNYLTSSLSFIAQLESRRKLITFMAFLCHEIRNPLFAITSTLSFLEDEQLTENQDRALRSLGQSTNDVLDISKLESGKLELEERDFGLREMLQNVANSTQTQMEQKHGGVDFRFFMAQDVPETVRGDSVRILQIVYNLLSNATKFTERGYIEFTVSIRDFQMALKDGVIRTSRKIDEGSNHHSEKGSSFCMSLLDAEEGKSDFTEEPPEITVLKLQVKDTGVGIAADRLDGIFIPYSQSKLSDYRKHGGTGLGLSILSRLSYIMGGSIAVDSIQGEGSTFAVYLPLRKSSRVFAADEGETHQIMVQSISSSRLPDLLPILDTETVFKNESHACSLTRTPFVSHESLTVAAAVSSTSIREPNHVGKGETSLLELSPQTASTSDVLAFAGSRGGGSMSSTDTSTWCESLLDSPMMSPTKRKPDLPKFVLPKNDFVVLITDDNLLNRKLLGRMLSHFNVEHHYACNGQEALDMVMKSRSVTKKSNDPAYVLLLMDISMPVMDGIEATKKIREAGQDMPIIALTACAIDSNKDEALEAGCTEFLTKPILRETLHEKCQHYIIDDMNEKAVFA